MATVAAPKDSKFTPVPISFLGTAASNSVSNQPQSAFSNSSTKSVGTDPLKLGDSSDANPKTEAKSDEKTGLPTGRGIFGSSWSGFDSKKDSMSNDKTDGLSGRSIFATGPTVFSASVGNASGGMFVTGSNSDNKAVWVPSPQPFGSYAKGGGTAGSGLKIEPEDKANMTTPRSVLDSDSSAVSTTWDSTAKRKGESTCLSSHWVLIFLTRVYFSNKKIPQPPFRSLIGFPSSRLVNTEPKRVSDIFVLLPHMNGILQKN